MPTMITVDGLDDAEYGPMKVESVLAVVRECEVTPKSNGEGTKLEITCEVYDPEKYSGRTLKFFKPTNVKGAGILKEFLDKCGVPIVNSQFDPSLVIGKKYRLELEDVAVGDGVMSRVKREHFNG